MAPPPPPPSSSEETTTMMLPDPMMVTPPPKHKTPQGYTYRRHGPSISKTAHSSPATSHASSAASPSQLLKTRSANEVLSPRVRGGRMDPYPRYSPRKRLSGDFSDGTFSGESGADSPRSEKGGWRIHAAVSGPFLTGPLATDFASRLEELRSPRGKKTEEPDFDTTGLLLFPVVPDFVAPAITPEVFQASIQPTPVTPTQATQPQPEPDHSAVAQQTDACYYPPQTDQYYAQPAATEATSEAAWDTAAQQQYYYAEEQQFSAEQQQQFSAQQQYYYNNGYDQQQYNNAAYTNGEYNYEQTYNETYDQSYEQPSAHSTEDFSAMSPENTEAFPPLPLHAVASPELDTPTEVATADVVASNQQAEPAAPNSPMRRSRAPSYAEVVSGAAHTTPTVKEPETTKAVATPKTPTTATFASFDQLSDGIADSMSRILAKSTGSKTHAEVEFACLVRRIQTQMKLMGRVSNSLHLKQMKTMHKLQKTEIEKLSVESSSMTLMAQVKKYEQEQAQLKTQLAEALQAKDVRLQDAVDQLSTKIDSLKNSTDASTSSLVSEIDAIRKCSSSDDLEKRVKEIGQVIDYLVENQTDASPSSTGAAPKRRPSKMEARRQSVGSWKALALYAIVVWAASLCGVWVGVKYAGTVNQSPVVATPGLHHVDTPVVVDSVPIVDSVPAFYEEFAPESVNVDIELPAAVDATEPVVEPAHLEDEVASTTEEAVEEVVVESAEAPTVTEVVEEVEAPVEVAAVVSEAEPAFVFTLEQMTRSSPSCFTSPSDHSTMASFFCEMLSEVVAADTLVVEDQSPVDEVATIDAAVTEPMVEVAVSPIGDVVADVGVDTVSNDWNSIVMPAEETEATIEEKAVAADWIETPIEEEAVVADETEERVASIQETTVVADEAEETLATIEEEAVVAEAVVAEAEETAATVEENFVVADEVVAPAALAEEIIEEVSTMPEVVASFPSVTTQRRSVTNLMNSPLVHALYVWCPSLFDMTPEEKDAASGPLGDLARALTSLSSQILADSTPSTIDELVDQSEAATFEIVQEVEEVEETFVEQVEAESEVTEEVKEVETAVVAEEIEAEGTTVDDVAIVTDEISTVEAEVPVATSSNRWATQQFLINVGVLSGAAEVAAVEDSVTSEQVDETVDAVVPVWAFVEEPTAFVAEEEAKYTNASTVEDVLPAAVFAEPVDIVEEITMETTSVMTEASSGVEETVSSCPLERCPLFEGAVVEEAEFANASLVAVAEPSVQLAEEDNETTGTSPAIDFKSLLLTSL